MKQKNKIRLLIIPVVLMCVTSCSAPKNLAYFQDVDEKVVAVEPVQIKIEPHDKISIIVKSKDPELSNLFNLTVSSMRLGQEAPVSGTGSESRNFTTSTESISSYTVTPQGTIDFPVLGEIKVEGMSRSQLAAFIKGELIGKELVKDPVVTVEFLNTGFSVMGEVNKAGRFDINKDLLSLPEALALAGDLTIQGRRENVAVVRAEKDGVRTYRVDLTNLVEMTKSPAYYVKQGDVIYVEPNGVKKRQATVNGNNVLSAGFWVSVASLLTSVAVLIFK